MKAMIETKEGMYLIRIYGSDGLPCDAYVVENIYYSEESIWDALGFIGYARFLCKRGKGQKAASELHEAINLLKEMPSDGHIGSLLVEASEGLQEAIDCLENGHISEAIRIMGTATAALKMVAKEISDLKEETK